MADSLWNGPLKILSKNYPAHGIGLNADGAATLAEKKRRFQLVSPGLTGEGDTVSFKSADKPDTYLRHCDYCLSAENQNEAGNPDSFAEDATFRVHRGLWFPGYFSFESVNFPGHFIRHCDWLFRISDESQEGNPDLFHEDASFRLVDGPYFLQSKNFPEHKFSLEGGSEAWMKDEGERFYLVRPALEGGADTVSVAPSDNPGKVLRHCNSELFSEDPCDCQNPELIHQDGSFHLNEGRFSDGYCALESVNFPSSYVRHCSARLRIDEDDGSDLMHDDACFRTIQGPGGLRSYNFPDSGMSCNESNEVVLSEDVTPLVLVFPGLNGQPGTVSLESSDRPGHFLRHCDYELWLEDRNDARNPDVFREDATFNLREDAWFEDTVSFESVNFPGFYVRHCNFRLRIDEFSDDDLYKQDASFKLEA